MKVQGSMFKVQKVRLFFTVFFLLFTTCCLLPGFAPADVKWKGVDKSVVERIAKEHGREAREPFINTDRGDLLLFVFLLAGAIGGFAAGYYWRKLIEQKQKGQQ